jgi:hypothetical protein
VYRLGIIVVNEQQVPAIFSGALAASSLILCAAAYAGFFSLGRLTGRAIWRRLSYAAYALVIGSTALFAYALRIDGYWWVLIAILLAGYALAPRAIWRLCIATHAQDQSGQSL